MTLPFINPVEVLQRRAQETPNRLSHMLLGATDAESHSLTYSQLDAEVKKMAAYLQSVAEPGQRALLVYPTSLEFVVAMFACMYAGIIPIPTNPPGMNRSAQRLEAIARDARARLVLTTPEYQHAFLAEAAQFPDFAALTWVTREAVEAGSGHSLQIPVITPQSTAFMQYTSGSTNIPKGVVISYRNFSHNMHALHETRIRGNEYADDSVILTWTPLFHDMGLLIGTFLTPMDGTPSILMPTIQFMQNPLNWLKAIQKFKATASGGPNFAYDLCVNKIPLEKCEGLDLSTWKIAYNSAEPVRAETQARFAEKFAPFGFRPEVQAPCYGMAETTLVISYYTGEKKTITQRFRRADFEEGRLVPSDSDEQKESVEAVSSGVPLVDYQIAIVHPKNRKRCAPNEVGEVWISGDSVGEGYWNRPEDTKHTFGAHIAETHEGPYLRTGDLGFMHDGHLYITGRLKDLLIVRGRNYYPQDVEMTVERTHPALRAGGGAAFSVTEDNVEQLVVVHETQRREMDGVDWNEVIKTIRTNVAREHGIRAHAVILIRRATIAKTSSGKIQRSEMKRQYLANELQIVAEWRAPS
ncbi:MAG: fatty acyl-AMP ligase [Anaerolineaceae bacterium]|nr:MAG: fatty acyl-AMP ligase [Anaerolineaceae bacterium]